MEKVPEGSKNGILECPFVTVLSSRCCEANTGDKSLARFNLGVLRVKIQHQIPLYSMMIIINFYMLFYLFLSSPDLIIAL